MSAPTFEKARPIWLEGLSEEMNLQAGFRAVFHTKPSESFLRVTGSSTYRIWLNGAFIGHGPARCGHGTYRVDEWRLPVVEGKNLVAIEVVGYNANSYAYLDQPAFLQAEVVSGSKILVATGSRSFSAYRIKERVQKTQKYSSQRTFTEVYKLTQRSAEWYTKLTYQKTSQPIDVLRQRKLIGRGVSYPAFETVQPVAQTATGTVRPLKDPKIRWGNAEIPNPNLKMFPADRNTLYPAHEIESLDSTVRSRKTHPYVHDKQWTLKPNQFRVLDLGINLTGFIGVHVECDEPVDLYFVFDELDTDEGDVDILRYHCANVVKYSLKPGHYDLESFEPYTLKYLKVLALNGSCRFSGVYLREYACPDAHRARFAASDPQLNLLFEAARQTFRQNSVDIFMDCPGRERAGWLCDSFFTARAERDLCGGNPIERNFLENYLLPKRFPHIAKGMLPMCYPADHNNGTFIPNWAMWFVIELEEYLNRSDDRELVDGLKTKVYDLIAYFTRFLNSDGLLESLEKWIFIEWSKANEFKREISYPSNMLYAGMLDAAGRLYQDDGLFHQAKQIRKVIRKQSFDGEYFVDNATRNEDGTLTVTRNRTETCQYYAFFFDVATPKRYPDLWQKLLTVLGPKRDPEKELPEIHPSNAFIGFFLRLDVLSRYQQTDLILEQLYMNYLPMAQRTGTLWEHKDTAASCNHGFASHVAHILYRDVLGIRVDPVSKSVEFRIPETDLDWCEGHIPVGDEWIHAMWARDGDIITHTLSVPRGYKTKVLQAGS